MRFDNVDIISFNDEGGNIFPVRDIKEIEEYQSGMDLDLVEGSDMDEIVSRPDVYGDDAEDLSYQAIEHNIVAIADARFDLDNLKKINIPIVSED